MSNSLSSRIAVAAANTHRSPSPAQKEAGNYQKGKFRWNGLEIAIETPKGGVRRGQTHDGHHWSVTMGAHYGYIRRTVSDADGDAVDVFIGPHPESDFVAVIDQQTLGGRFDEHKAVIGTRNLQEARELYLSCYSAGWQGLKSITPMTRQQFVAWLRKGDTGKPIERQVSKYSRFDLAAAHVELYAKGTKKPAAGQGEVRWITIHPHGNEEGTGTPVKIDGKGDIVGGPKGLADKGIKKLSDFGKGKGESKPSESSRNRETFASDVAKEGRRKKLQAVLKEGRILPDSKLLDEFASEDWVKDAKGEGRSKNTGNGHEIEQENQRRTDAAKKRLEDVNVDFKGIDYVPHPVARDNPDDFETVHADAAKLDQEWSKDQSHYLPKEGKGQSEIEGRRDRFTEHLKSGQPVQQPHVVVNDSGNLAFEDGRHRTRVLMNSGEKTIPLTVPKEDAGKVKGLVGGQAGHTNIKDLQADIQKAKQQGVPQSVWGEWEERVAGIKRAAAQNLSQNAYSLTSDAHKNSGVIGTSAEQRRFDSGRHATAADAHEEASKAFDQVGNKVMRDIHARAAKGHRETVKQELGEGPSRADVARTHNVKLPRSGKPSTIQKTAEALSQMGYELGNGRTDLKNMQTVYELKHPDGRTSTASIDEIQEIIKRGHEGYGKRNNPDRFSRARFLSSISIYRT